MVEGHTDDVPINNSCTQDNWDLSVKRATSIVRILTVDHYVDPSRLTASGRGQFVPKTENDTDEGRSLNRRTEIIIMPRLDQFFDLMEPAVVKG
ncbi:MAG: OmpA family protein [Bacteroidota bacterium]